MVYEILRRYVPQDDNGRSRRCAPPEVSVFEYAFYALDFSMGFVGRFLIGAVFNIIFDPVFIFIFHWGVKGAALATITGQIISFFVLLAGTKKGGNIRLRAANVRFSKYYLLSIVNGGIPALFRQGMTSVATILLNRAAGVYGEVMYTNLFEFAQFIVYRQGGRYAWSVTHSSVSFVRRVAVIQFIERTHAQFAHLCLKSHQQSAHKTLTAVRVDTQVSPAVSRQC